MGLYQVKIVLYGHFPRCGRSATLLISPKTRVQHAPPSQSEFTVVEVGVYSATNSCLSELGDT